MNDHRARARTLIFVIMLMITVTSVVYGFVQRAEAERQAILATKAIKELNMCRENLGGSQKHRKY